MNCTATSANAHTSLTSATTQTPVEQMAASIQEVSGSDIFIRSMNAQMITWILTFIIVLW